MDNEAYQFKNLIIVRNGLSFSGMKDISDLLLDINAYILEKLKDSDIDKITIPLSFPSGGILACQYDRPELSFYYSERQKTDTLNTNKYSVGVNAVDARVLYHNIPAILKEKQHSVARYIRAYQHYHINGMELKISKMSKEAEINNDYSKEYKLLNIENIHHIDLRTR